MQVNGRPYEAALLIASLGQISEGPDQQPVKCRSQSGSSAQGGQIEMNPSCALLFAKVIHHGPRVAEIVSTRI